MTGATIASIVEGYGEVRALPVLLRRIAAELGVWDLTVPTPYRLGRGKMTMDGGLEAVVGAQAHRITGSGGVLVLLDADDDCPADLGPRLRGRAARARPDVPVSVILANKEFEAWFLASAESLAGKRGLPADLESPMDPEAVRDAKGWLGKRFSGHPYRATTDQPALAAIFDMSVARQTSGSFAKLWRDVERLLGVSGE